MRKYVKSTEKPTQTHILEFLEHEGYKVFARINSGRVFTRQGRLFRGAPAGWADIIGATKQGRFMAIEVKSKGTYQNPEQKAFQKEVDAIGGLYVVVRSVEELMLKLQLESKHGET
jgi:hypothetical protein